MTLRFGSLHGLCAWILLTCPLHGDILSAETAGIAWPGFLHRSDMVWNRLPRGWDQAPFTGNGTLGTIFWENKDRLLRFEVSRSDLYDHRRVEGPYSPLYSQCRLPNGQFLLDLGPEPSGGMRLDLWNAEVRGNIATATGTWTLRTFTHATMNLIVVELVNAEPGAGAPPVWTWHPDLAETMRREIPKGATIDLAPYPPQQQTVIDGINVSIQSMPESARYRTNGRGVGQYATAWTTLNLGPGHIVYLVSMGYSYPGTTAARQAVDTVLKGRSLGLDGLTESHRAWWHAYYPKSFLSIPDGPLESFYWIQIYKMGSASHQGGPLIDLEGPWYKPGEWPGTWWNLNTQLSYWPFYMSNHLEEAQPLNDFIWKGRKMLAQNAAPFQADSYAIGRYSGPSLEEPVGPDVGNLAWVMHNLWLYYRSTMDENFLRERLFPLMKRSFRYLRHIAVTNPDGTIAMPATASPEYTDKVENSSYTLACFRWLAQAIVAADTRLQAHDPVAAECRKVLARLVPYEIDPATGVEVGQGMPFIHSHRHWSHLFMIYPFHEWDWNDPAKRPLMEKSLANWTANTSGFTGFSWVGAASMEADAGNGDKALEFLHTFLARSPLPNTLYREGYPVIETPLACARAIQELVMTSYGDCIRIFPGLPSTWKDASFADFRAQGAFLVTAQRRGGVTRSVTIKSLAGEPCRVRASLPGPVRAQGDRAFTVKDAGNGIVQVDLAKGETVTLYSGTLPATAVEPVALPAPSTPWGQYQSPRPSVPVALADTTRGSPNVLAIPEEDFPYNQTAAQALDGNLNTKYDNTSRDGTRDPGVNSGLLIPFASAPRIVTGFQFATADNAPESDPLTVTIEGSNAPDAMDEGGNGFVLLWEGASGLEPVLQRKAWGEEFRFNNTTAYATYRVLITGTRGKSTGVQYSEIKLLGPSP